MADIQRISVQQAHSKTKANQALLVCAYEDEAKCRMLNLEGSIPVLRQNSMRPENSAIPCRDGRSHSGYPFTLERQESVPRNPPRCTCIY